MKNLMESLLAQVGNDDNHPVADFLDIVSSLVEQYEDKSPDAEFKAKPNEVLRLLMQEHELIQADLRKEVGTQGVVSEILRGEKMINIRQAKALAEKFGVSPLVFL